MYNEPKDFLPEKTQDLISSFIHQLNLMARSQKVNRDCGCHCYVVADIQSWHHEGWTVKGMKKGFGKELCRSYTAACRVGLIPL